MTTTPEMVWYGPSTKRSSSHLSSIFLSDSFSFSLVLVLLLVFPFMSPKACLCCCCCLLAVALQDGGWGEGVEGKVEGVEGVVAVLLETVRSRERVMNFFPSSSFDNEEDEEKGRFCCLFLSLLLFSFSEGFRDC